MLNQSTKSAWYGWRWVGMGMVTLVFGSALGGAAEARGHGTAPRREAQAEPRTDQPAATASTPLFGPGSTQGSSPDTAVGTPLARLRGDSSAPSGALTLARGRETFGGLNTDLDQLRGLATAASKERDLIRAECVNAKLQEARFVHTIARQQLSHIEESARAKDDSRALFDYLTLDTSRLKMSDLLTEAQGCAGAETSRGVEAPQPVAGGVVPPVISDPNVRPGMIDRPPQASPTR